MNYAGGSDKPPPQKKFSILAIFCPVLWARNDIEVNATLTVQHELILLKMIVFKDIIYK
jgi:hypothetical protein